MKKNNIACIKRYFGIVKSVVWGGDCVCKH